MNASTHRSLAGFGQSLIETIALPELARGYAGLVQHFRQQDLLAGLAREQGVDVLLSSDRAELAALQKSNKELVTTAEKVAERSMTQAVRARYPTHAIVGEEHGYTPGGETRWVFDPVDGTSAMIRTAMSEAFDVPLGQPRPSFGITLAVVEGDEAILGIVAELRPNDGVLRAVNCWRGEHGKATTVDGRPVSLPPAPAALATAVLACTVPEVMFNSATKWSGYQALVEATGGCLLDQNCIGFMRILQEDGGIDVVYEADLAYHDVAALVPILRGAGVTVTDGGGNPLTFPIQAIAREFSVLAAQPAVHARALERVLAGVAPAANRFSSRGEVRRGYAQKFPAGPA